MTISFSCLVENPGDSVDRNLFEFKICFIQCFDLISGENWTFLFHLGISEMSCRVCPNIGPFPNVWPTGTRVGKNPKCVANMSRINSSSIVRIVGVKRGYDFRSKEEVMVWRHLNCSNWTKIAYLKSFSHVTINCDGRNVPSRYYLLRPKISPPCSTTVKSHCSAILFE